MTDEEFKVKATKFVLAAMFAALLASPASAKPMAAMKMSMPGMRAMAKVDATQETRTVEGQVVDTWCYFHVGASGMAHRTCAMTCARNGAPMGLVDDKGDLYVLASATVHSGPQKFISFMADRVSATGEVVDKGGVRLFFVSAMKKLAAAK